MDEFHASALRLHGLTEHSAALAYYRTPKGVEGHFWAPARHCFRCVGVCPSYWSLFLLADYASKVSHYAGSDVWYALTKDHPRTPIISHAAPIIPFFA